MASKPKRDRTGEYEDELSPETKADNAIMREAKKRFKGCQDWESSFQGLYVVDVKFANADSDNGWQWPDDLKRDREDNKRPCLTINKVQHHVNMICNDMRKNKSSISVRPTGKESSFKSAQIYEGLIRHIESKSNAQTIYDSCMQSQVEGGIGYFRITTKWDSDDDAEAAWNQSICMEPVRDQMGVYLDRDIVTVDGSDGMYGFIFDEMTDDDFEAEYPNIDLTEETGLGDGEHWVRDGKVRVAEYYRIKKTKDEWIYLEDENGEHATFKRSEIPKEMKKAFKEAEKNKEQLIAEGKYRTRPLEVRQLEWYKIAGSKIVARRKLKGQYIPIVRFVGRERIIDGKLERKGLVRSLKDAQRMYNYNTSGQVEYGALATKTPWVGPKKAFDGNEVAWNKANVTNAAYLTYNDWDPDRGENGQAIAAPIKPEAPGSSPAFLTGMEIASRELEATSGQFAAQKGMESNERSGKAIAERQHQSDTANYDFPDNVSVGIRYAGVIIIDMAPHIYDTERVIQILGRDGTQTLVTVDPDLEAAHKEEARDKDEVRVLFNPKVGKYMIEADIGPAYSTQRQEAWNAFVQIVTGSPEMINDVGDLMFQSADFPLADKIAERLRKKIRAAQPYLFDDEAPTPAMQTLKMELEKATQQVAELLEQLGDTKRKLASKDQRRDIEAFRAETSRVKDLANSVEDLMHQPAQAAQLMKAISDALRNMGADDITDTVDAAQNEMSGRKALDAEPGAEGEQAPVPGAKQAADGEWYVPDPKRQGKYLQVGKKKAA